MEEVVYNITFQMIKCSVGEEGSKCGLVNFKTIGKGFKKIINLRESRNIE